MMDSNNFSEKIIYISMCSGGRGGIRTHGGREPTAIFKTAAFNHSATRPARRF
jgi:hypothetical protein